MFRFIRSGLFLVFAGLAIAGCSASKQAATSTSDPSIIATVGSETIRLDEFESRYARTGGGREGAADDSIGAYRDFLDRYVNFRMKVQAARELGLFENEDIMRELASYRRNFGRPYLLDEKVNEPLMRRYFERMRLAVDASHILITVPQDAKPADTLQAYLRIRRIADSLKTGADFGDLALRNSQDPSARNEGGPGFKGRLGFFTHAMMVEPFEQYAYETPVGEVSPIFRTRFGYHILKVHDRKTAIEPIRVAHIMVIPNPQDTARAYEKMKLVQAKLAEGQEFATVAREYSEHEATAGRGGELGILNYYGSQVPESFRDAAFALKNPGDVSGVFRTPFGLHIVKMLERTDLSSIDANYDRLKQYVQQLPATKAAEKALGEQIRTRRGAVLDSAAVQRVFSGMTRDSVLQVLFTGKLSPEMAGVQIASLADSIYTVQDLSAYLATGQHNPPVSASLVDIANGFLTDSAIDYEAAALVGSDPEFTRVMEEFEEGLVLFKIMEDSVWTVAQQDSLGLAQYHQAHRTKYQFPERIRAIAFHTVNDSLLRVVSARFEGGATVQDMLAFVAQDASGQVRADTIYVDRKTNTDLDAIYTIKEGEHVGPLMVNRRRVILYRDGVEPPREKTFEEARSEVVSDYQQVVEERFIERLRQRYKPQTYPDRLDGAFAAERKTQASTAGVAPGGN